MKYSLNVNGKTETVDVPDRMPLLWVLRDALNLKGTKFGCGIAQCGACTVQIDGQATRACITPVSAVGARKVTTIESLPADGSHIRCHDWLALRFPTRGCSCSHSHPRAPSTRRQGYKSTSIPSGPRMEKS